jgi:hypothetical protein
MRHASLLVLAGVVLLVAAQAPATTPPKPDLRCSELTADKVETMEVPLRVRVFFVVKNFGTGNFAAYTCRLSYRKGASGAWQAVQDYTVPFSPPNNGAQWHKLIDLAEGGTYTFKVEVDVNHVITESNEGNNTKTVTKTFSSGTPDLTVTNVDAQITHTTSSGTVYTKVTWDVENIGDGKASGSFVTVIKVSKNNGTFVELARYTRSNLQAGSAYHFTDNHSFTGVNKLKFRIQTDATGAITERSNANNTADSGTLQL